MTASRAGSKGIFVYVPDDLKKKFNMKAARLGLSHKKIFIDFLEAFCVERGTDGTEGHSKSA